LPKDIINGYKMHYGVYGKGEPLIMIHGGLGGGEGSANIVRHHSQQLSSEFKLIVFDRRASGKSEPAKDGYFISNYSRDVSALLDHLSVGKAHILGSSAGGPIAMQFALDNPQRAATLSLVNTMSYVDEEQRNIRQRELALLENTEASSQRTQAANALDVRRPGMREAEPQYFQQLLDLHLKQYDGIVKTMRSYIDIGSSIETRLSELNMPTIIIHGSDDSRIPIKFGQALTSRIKNSTFIVIDGAEHGLLANEPDKIRQTLKPFWNHNSIN
jgi:pimeloyl-ACP methyl ester carboxylesterase